MRIGLVAASLLALGVAFVRRPSESPERVIRASAPEAPSIPVAAGAATAREVPPGFGDGAGFVSCDGDGRRRRDVVQDGVVVQVVDERGVAGGALAVAIDWEYLTDDGWQRGRDRGTTDEHGRLRTSVRRTTQIQLVEVEAAELGAMQWEGEVQPSRGDENLVVVVIPAIARLTVRVVDTAGS